MAVNYGIDHTGGDSIMIFCTCGFIGTGSSAAVHLLSEYENCKIDSDGQFEHLPLYTPDGLFDLEDRLLLNNSIHMADAAIRQFRAAMKRLNDTDFDWFGGYQRRYGDRFMELVDAFIEELVEYTFPGSWSYDIQDVFSPGGLVKDVARKALGKPVRHMGHRLNHTGDNQIFYSFVTPEKYYAAARKFIKGYCDMVSGGSDKILLCDQLLTPQNLYRVSRYFDRDDIRVIVVDRDPRDMYVLFQYVWPAMSGGTSTYFKFRDAEDFIRFYSAMKDNVPAYDSDIILNIHFEDMIYDYDRTTARIEAFFGGRLGAHVHPQQRFQPEVSVKNTQNFRIRPEWEEEVQVIAEKMTDSLYSFPYTLTPRLEETSDP